MSFREHLNVAYFRLVDGKDKVERAQVDAMLAPPEQQEALLAKQNQLAMQEIMSRAGSSMIGPRPRTTG